MAPVCSGVSQGEKQFDPSAKMIVCMSSFTYLTLDALVGPCEAVC